MKYFDKQRLRTLPVDLPFTSQSISYVGIKKAPSASWAEGAFELVLDMQSLLEYEPDSEPEYSGIQHLVRLSRTASC
jgi:hypothetical protein